jgi:glyoxylase-like metal-dependent hydrolase (beta-lactamase superfamily II)
MTKRLGVVMVLALIGGAPAAGQLEPGFVDPRPVLEAAAKAIGVDQVRCITMAGTGYAGMVGQQRESGVNIDWPRSEPLTNYSRTMNWDAGTMVEEFDRKPGLHPASWKWGVRYIGGTPTAKNARQVFKVNGKYGWSMDGAGSNPVPMTPDAAERMQLELWMNPHGFLKLARKPGANPVATWRWELNEMGRDGPEVKPYKVTVVAITVLGKYRVDATINPQNMLQRIHTQVADPVLGDLNYEHEWTDDSYVDVGNGVRFPAGWHHHQGWDDNFQAQAITAGHNAFGGQFKAITANSCGDPVAVPDSVRQAAFPVRVETTKLAEGVWLLGGASHNSVAVEFSNYVAVVEAPLDEKRSLAVIAEITRLVPDKPIRFVVNTHQHFDHLGGIRTYLHIGATTITHWKNWDFYNRDVLNYDKRTVEPDMVTLWPPTELAEGYQYETVRQNYVLSDDKRNMNIYYVQPLQHAEGMLMAYLPAERFLIEADLFNTHEPPPTTPTPAMTTLMNNVKTLKLEPSQIVPIHGRPVPWSDFVKAMSGRGTRN